MILTFRLELATVELRAASSPSFFIHSYPTFHHSLAFNPVRERQRRLLKLRHNRPLRDRQRNPASNQTQPPNRRDRTHDLPEPLRVEHKQIQAAGEHGHTRSQQPHGDGILRRRHRRKGQDRRVDELVLCCRAPVRWSC